jgi:hypothetical protein
MYDYILEEDIENHDIKIQKLLKSTTRLIKAMNDVKKLTRNGISVYGSKPSTKNCTAAMAGYYR